MGGTIRRARTRLATTRERDAEEEEERGAEIDARIGSNASSSGCSTKTVQPSGAMVARR